MSWKPNIHKPIALSWVVSSPWAFAPVMENTKRPDAGAILAWGVAIVAVMIFAAPMLLLSPVFRRLFGWADTLSESHRHALANRSLRRHYQAASEDGYSGRMKPYFWRFVGTMCVLIVLESVLSASDNPAVLALCVFCMWYPIGVLLVIVASSPWFCMVMGRSNTIS